MVGRSVGLYAIVEFNAFLRKLKVRRGCVLHTIIGRSRRKPSDSLAYRKYSENKLFERFSRAIIRSNLARGSTFPRKQNRL